MTKMAIENTNNRQNKIGSEITEYSSKYPYPIIPYIALVALKWNCFLQLKGVCRLPFMHLYLCKPIT